MPMAMTRLQNNFLINSEILITLEVKKLTQGMLPVSNIYSTTLTKKFFVKINLH